MTDQADPKVTPDSTNAPGHDAVRFTETMDQAKQKIAEEQVANTAEGLGVDQASFDKYYKDGNFDWASYGKEQAFKAQQAAKEPAKDAEEPKDDQGQQAATEADQQTLDNAAQTVEAAGLNWDELGQQIVETGNITEADKAALTKIGVPEVVIDDYIRIVHQQASDHMSNVINAFGGEENFSTIYDALSVKATQEQRDSIDNMLQDPSTFNMGVQMAAELAGAAPPTPVAPTPSTPITTPNASGGGEPAAKGFENMGEQVAAMRDPKYKTDPEYRAQVIKRVQASTFEMNPRTHTSGL